MIPATNFARERRILTLHVPQRTQVVDEVLTAVEAALLSAGASRVWIDPSASDDMTVMATLPDNTPADELVAVPLPRGHASSIGGSRD